MDQFHLVKWILPIKWLLQQRSSLFVAFFKRKTPIHLTSFVTWLTTRNLKNWILRDFLQHHQVFATHKTCIYLQSQVWLRSCFAKSLAIDPLKFSYKLQDDDDDDDDEEMKPNIMTISLPQNLPIPCKCGRYAGTNLRICRVNNIQLQI